MVRTVSSKVERAYMEDMQRYGQAYLYRDCRGSMEVYEKAVGRARVYRGGRVNAHEEVLSAQQDLSGMGSMKKGGVFI